jgi:cell division septum initiation protein DivIVA
MTISPVELHHIGLKRGLLGYRRQPVDRLIDEIAESFEEVWRQRADFADRIEQLESELARHHDVETLLRSTLVSAERSAHEQKDQARREAGLVVEEAHAEARAVTRAAAAGASARSRRAAGRARCSRPRSTPSTTVLMNTGRRLVRRLVRRLGPSRRPA